MGGALRIVLVCGLAAVLCVIPFLIAVVPPMTDVSQHVLVARIIAAYDDPGLKYSDYFDLAWGVTPGVLFYAILAGLQLVTAPYLDVRIYLVFWVFATFYAVMWLAKRYEGSSPHLSALAAIPLAFSWYVYMGFLPFLMTLPLFAVTIAVWLGREWSIVKLMTIWALFVLLFGFHIVGAAAAAGTIGVMAISTWLREARPRVLGEAAVSVLPAFVLGLLYFGGAHPPKAQVTLSNPFFNLVDVVKYTCGTLSDGAAVLMVLWIIILAGLVVLSLRVELMGHVPLLAAIVSLLLISAVMPSDLGALWPAGPRLFPYAVILVCVYIPWARWSPGIITGVFLLLLVMLSSFTVRHVNLMNPDYRDFLSGIEVVEPGGRVLPVLVDPSEGSKWVDPYWSLASAYTIAKGGVSPYVFAIPYIKTGASPLRYRLPSQYRPYAFLYNEGSTPDDYRGVSAFYDYVIIWGEAAGLEGVLSSEMVKIHRRGRLVIYSSRVGDQLSVGP